MNPYTNRFEKLTPKEHAERERRKANLKQMIAEVHGNAGLLRPDGSPVPAHWSTFKVGEHVEIKGYTFKIAYIGETSILFEPVGPVVLGEAGGVESPRQGRERA